MNAQEWLCKWSELVNKLWCDITAVHLHLFHYLLFFADEKGCFTVSLLVSYRISLSLFVFNNILLLQFVAGRFFVLKCGTLKPVTSITPSLGPFKNHLLELTAVPTWSCPLQEKWIICVLKSETLTKLSLSVSRGLAMLWDLACFLLLLPVSFLTYPVDFRSNPQLRYFIFFMSSIIDDREVKNILNDGNTSVISWNVKSFWCCLFTGSHADPEVSVAVLKKKNRCSRLRFSAS